MIRALDESGMLSTVASIYGYLIILLEVLFGLFLAKKMKIKWWHAAVILVCGIALVMFLNPFVYWIERGFKGGLYGGALTRIYLILPAFYLLIFKLLKVDKKRGFDLVALCYLFFQGFAHIGCTFTGCCGGAVSDTGVWNPGFNRYTFPTQIFDGLTALLIFAIVFAFVYKNKWNGGGFLYPILLTSHGITRFFWDFKRIDPPKLACGLTTLQIWAIALFAVGMTCLYVQIHLYEKQNGIKPASKNKKRKKKHKK
ncbi:MAG: prolipoprotein diacylglyceryl transferase [Clostridia bacterium]|nr:prolipoprotein diacylglyceryl transferase [Clostridia bacterium]